MSLNASVTSYPPTQQEFINHWTLTNAARPAALVLNTGATIATLTGQRTALEAAISNANSKADAVTTVSNTRAALHDKVRLQMDEFRRAAAYVMGGKAYSSKIARLPGVSASDEAYGAAGDTYIYAWTQFNADTTVPAAQKPLVLPSGVTLAVFAASISSVRNSVSALNMAEQVATNARKTRDDLLLPARDLLKLYKAAILSLYPATSNEVKTLPRLWERATPNPDAVKLKVAYTAGAATARLSWSQVTDPSVERLLVFISPGARYKDSAARQLADLAPQITQYDLPDGTITPGSTNWFKVATVDDDGNQALSGAVKVERAG